MVYTELKERNGRSYYYRVISVRTGNKIGKRRIYLGSNLSPEELTKKETQANTLLIKQKINKNIEKIKSLILPILKKYKVKKAGIFGSYARGEETKKSDVDIIIEPPEGMGLEFVRLSDAIEKALKKKVDLLTYGYINKYIKPYVMRDEVRIYG